MKSIGEAADRFGLPTHVLRHWEAEGLLTPTRQGARRRYTDTDLYQIAAILLAKQAGFSIPDIRAVLTSKTAETRHKVMAAHIAELESRIAKAQAALAMLQGGLDCPHDNVLTCPHFQAQLRALPGCEDLPAPESLTT